MSANNWTGLAEYTLGLLSREALETQRHSRVAEDTIVKVASIAEAHVDKALDRLSLAANATANQFQISMLRAIEMQMHQSWSQRLDWLSNGFGISIKGTKESTDFLLLIDLRNAIVHGTGGLSPQQSKSLKERLRLESSFNIHLDALVSGDRIKLSSSTTRSAFDFARAFVLRLDKELSSSEYARVFA